MKCILCGGGVRKMIRVKGVWIYECGRCELGMREHGVAPGTRQRLVKKVKINNSVSYNFDEYQTQEKRLRKRFEWIAELVSSHKKEGRVLEVGAGYGLFASELLKKGDYKLEIVEPELTPHYLFGQTFRQHLMTVEDFLKRNPVGDTYDLIILIDVIEHFKNPVLNLQKLKKLLTKGGVMVIQTPNYKSLFAWLSGEDWSWWMVEDHHYFLTPQSLKLLLDKVQSPTIHLTTYEEWEDVKKNLDGRFLKIKSIFLRYLTKLLFLLFFKPAYFASKKLLWRENKGGLIVTISWPT